MGHITPIIQMSLTECGLCSATMLMEFYGVKLKIHDITTKFEVGRDGSSVGDLRKIFEKYKFDMSMYEIQGGISKIRQDAIPCIAYEMRGHFVVLEKIKGDIVTILDPAIGRRHITREELESDYKNVILRISPGEGFKKINTRKKEFHLIAEAVSHSKKLLMWAMLSAIAVYALTLAIPILIRDMINGLISDEMAYSSSVRLMWIIGGSSILFYIINQIKLALTINLSIKADRYLSDRVIDKLLRNKFEYFLNRTSSEIQYRLVLLKNLKTVISETLINALLEVGVMIVIMIYVASYDFLYAVLLLGITLVLVCFSLAVRNRMLLYKNEELANDSAVQILQNDMFRSIFDVKILGLDCIKKQQWKEKYEKYIDSHSKNQHFSAIYRNVMAYVSLYFPVAIVVLGVIISELAGINQIGTIISLQALSGVYISGLISLTQLVETMTTLKTLLLRIEDILVQDDEKNGDIPISIKGNIDVKGLTFKYPGAKENVLSDVSFNVKAGESVAIVGESGSGKSTLFYTLLGAYENYMGEILYEGHELRTLQKESFRKQIASVPQNSILFNGSIKDNLSYGNEITDEKMFEVLQKVSLYDFVKSLPMGLDTVISENAFNMSGGQRQRIAIARAIVEEKPLIVLDEATSSLDNVTEQRVVDYLNSSAQTRIVIAHRLDTIRECDKIIVMKNGRIVETGDHETLMAAGGEYYRMYSREKKKEERKTDESIAS